MLSALNNSTKLVHLAGREPACNVVLIVFSLTLFSFAHGFRG